MYTPKEAKILVAFHRRHRAATVDSLKPGDKIYIWWDTGAMGPNQWYGTVIRVNRVTVTALMENRDKPSRIPKQDIHIPTEEA